MSLFSNLGLHLKIRVNSQSCCQIQWITVMLIRVCYLAWTKLFGFSCLLDSLFHLLCHLPHECSQPQHFLYFYCIDATNLQLGTKLLTPYGNVFLCKIFPKCLLTKYICNELLTQHFQMCQFYLKIVNYFNFHTETICCNKLKNPSQSKLLAPANSQLCILSSE